MTTKDYVKRAKKVRKPPVRRPVKTASGPAIRPSSLLATLLVAGATLFLYQSIRPAQDENADETALFTPKENTLSLSSAFSQTVNQPLAAPKEEPLLPPKPQEKWTYIKVLENKDVKVNANEQELSARPYLMQCGAFRTEHQAEQRRAGIAFQGLESEIRISQASSGTWYRVVLGPYPKKRTAERDMNNLRRVGIEPCAIWFWE
ncbi:MAG: SPOR domain-containing protein [Vibrionaceae bacterium]